MKGSKAPAPDLTAQGQARLAPARNASGSVIPAAVWEDAERQLAGMLGALATLQEDVPALGEPSIMGATPDTVSARGVQASPGAPAGDEGGPAGAEQRR